MRKKGGAAKPAIQVIPIAEVPNSALTDLTVSKKAMIKKPAAVHRSPRVKVLVVDDQQMIAQTLAEILGRNGYECFAVSNGEAAIAAAESFTPNVVLSDVVMPGMNGVEACVRIKKHLPDCRILLFSSHVPVAHSLMQEATRAGHSFELLAKPVEPRELVAKIEALVAGAHSQAGLQRAEARA
jgi:DNA-binding response OmpR family regulator